MRKWRLQEEMYFTQVHKVMAGECSLQRCFVAVAFPTHWTASVGSKTQSYRWCSCQSSEANLYHVCWKDPTQSKLRASFKFFSWLFSYYCYRSLNLMCHVKRRESSFIEDQMRWSSLQILFSWHLMQLDIYYESHIPWREIKAQWVTVHTSYHTPF